MPWTRMLRRSAAFFVAAVTLWVLTLTADMGAATESIKALGESGAFVESALRAELGAVAVEDGPLSGLTVWERLVLGQSALLRAGEGAVADYLSGQEEHGDPAVEPEVVQPPAEETPVLTGGGDGPQILIIHTHSSEAYTPDDGNTYQESDSYRTTDTRFNVVHVGDTLAAAYGEAGFTVLHDRNLYDYPQYSGAYGRSYAAVEGYLAQYPSISVVLDVHRDAIYNEDGSVGKVVAQGLETTAQTLLVVGSNQNELHPNFAQNLAFANALQGAIEGQQPTLSRGVSLRASHYNQQLSPGYLLLEVGGHGNTLTEAVNAANYFAQTTSQTIWTLLNQEK